MDSPLLSQDDSVDEEGDEDLEHYPHKSTTFRQPRSRPLTALSEPPQRTCILIYFAVLLLITICFCAPYTAFRLSVPPPRTHGKSSHIPARASEH